MGWIQQAGLQKDARDSSRHCKRLSNNNSWNERIEKYLRLKEASGMVEKGYHRVLRIKATMKNGAEKEFIIVDVEIPFEMQLLTTSKNNESL
jgi:hypothetical protein